MRQLIIVGAVYAAVAPLLFWLTDTKLSLEIGGQRMEATNPIECAALLPMWLVCVAVIAIRKLTD